MKPKNIIKSYKSQEPPSIAKASVPLQQNEVKSGKRQNSYQPSVGKIKRLSFSQQLNLDKLNQFASATTPVPRKDKENSAKHTARLRKKSFEQKNSLHVKPKRNSCCINEQHNVSTRLKPNTGRSNHDIKKRGKSLQMKQYASRPIKRSKSQSSQSHSRSQSKDKMAIKPLVHLNSRPKSIYYSNKEILNNLLTAQLNKSEQSNKLRQLFNSLKQNSIQQLLSNQFQRKTLKQVFVDKRESLKKVKTKKKGINVKRRHPSVSQQITQRQTKKKVFEKCFKSTNMEQINQRNFTSVDGNQHQLKVSVNQFASKDESIFEHDEINLKEIRDFELKRNIEHNIHIQDNQQPKRSIQETKELLLRHIEVPQNQELIVSQNFQTLESDDQEQINNSQVLIRLGRQRITADALRVNENEKTEENIPQSGLEQIGSKTVDKLSRKLVDFESSKPIFFEEKGPLVQQIIAKIKQEELSKWNNLVQIISESLQSQSVDAKELLKKIAQKSEQNRTSLKNQVQQTQAVVEQTHSDQESSDYNGSTDPFEQFNSRKYRQLLDPSVIDDLIKSREKFLAERQKIQKKLIQDKFETDQISIGSYKRHCDRIEKWVDSQKTNIQKTKKDIQMGLGKAKESIKKTQLDYVIMLKLKQSPKQSFIKSRSSEVLHNRSRHENSKHSDEVSVRSSDQQIEKYLISADFDIDEQPVQENEGLGETNTMVLKDKLAKLQMMGIENQNSPQTKRLIEKQIQESPDFRNGEEYLEYVDEEVSEQRGLSRQTHIPLHLAHVDRPENDVQLRTVLNQCQQQEESPQIKNDDSIITERQLKVKPRGIKANFAVVRQYTISLKNYLLKYRFEALKALQRPTGPTPREMLKYMREYDIDQSEQQISNQILSNTIFDDHWNIYRRTLDFQSQTLDPQEEANDRQYLQEMKDMTRYFCYAIFEAYNECLAKQRNFGAFGQPYPWKRLPNFHHSIQCIPTINKRLQSSANRLLNIARTLCGIIFDTSLYSSDYIEQVQTDRMVLLVHNDLIENEPQWLFYDDEETEVLMGLTSLITDMLISEMVNFLFKS